jgi:hypothetical protein
MDSRHVGPVQRAMSCLVYPLSYGGKGYECIEIGEVRTPFEA